MKTLLGMNTSNYKHWQLLLPVSVEEPRAKSLFDRINNNEYDLVSILKDTYRSKVFRIKIDELDLVLKIPNEKNSRPWIRFLSWFRKGEAFKNIMAMELLWKLKIKTTVPLIAAEKRKYGMVINSWLLYEYIDGQPCLDLPESHPKVITTLQKIHRHGFLHGDPQIRNFIYKEADVYTIDSNPKKVGFTGFDIGYEWAYLRKSYPGIEQFFGDINKSRWYKFAIQWDLLDRKIARARKKVKGFFGFS